jgi:hypothetical protein
MEKSLGYKKNRKVFNITCTQGIRVIKIIAKKGKAIPVTGRGEPIGL